MRYRHFWDLWKFAGAAARNPGLTPPEPLGVDCVIRRFCYEDTALLTNIHLVLPAGSWTCLLGPSGVGKSSLLRLIAGLETADDSYIRGFDGASLRGRVAYMAQEDLLLPWATALGNVLLGARLRGEADQKEVALDLLDAMGLRDFAGHLPGQLSGGMRQRVALARTLMENRPLLLMDEPFSAIDTPQRLKLQDLAAEMLAGRTILHVTHDPLEALRLSHRIAIMAGSPARIDGVIEVGGTPPRTVTDPVLLRMQGELLAQLAQTVAAQ